MTYCYEKFIAGSWEAISIAPRHHHLLRPNGTSLHPLMTDVLQEHSQRKEDIDFLVMLTVFEIVFEVPSLMESLGGGRKFPS